MKIINSINYPYLDFANDRIPWDNRRFKDIWKKLTPDETIKGIITDPKLMNHEMMKLVEKMPEAHGLMQKPTGKRVANWPLFAITPEDYENIGQEGFNALTNMVNTIWTLPLNETENENNVEIVKGSLWDDMYCKGPDGFGEWIDSKNEDFQIKGTILRPQEEVVEKYFIICYKGEHKVGSLCINGRNLLWVNLHYTGFVSSLVQIPDELKKIAKERGCEEKTALFQEDMYNILKYLYYKEHFMLKPRKVEKFETITDREGYDNFRVVTDVPCIIYDGKNNS